MKKKQYTTPRIQQVPMTFSQILCGSITTDGTNLRTTLDDGEFGSGETINAREFSW